MRNRLKWCLSNEKANSNPPFVAKIALSKSPQINKSETNQRNINFTIVKMILWKNYLNRSDGLQVMTENISTGIKKCRKVHRNFKNVIDSNQMANSDTMI